MKKTLWRLALVSILLAFPTSGCSTSRPSSILQTVKSEIATEVNAPNFTQAELDGLVSGGWVLKQIKPLNIQGKQYSVVGAAQPDWQVNYGGKGKFILFRYENGKWLNIWSSPDIKSGFTQEQIRNSPSIPIAEIVTYQPKNSDLTLVGSYVMDGGNHGFGTAIAFTIDQKGEVTLRKSKSDGGMKMSQKADGIEISGDGLLSNLTIKDNQYVEKETAMSEMSPKDTVKAYFILGEGSELGVLPAKENTFTLKVGSTISFVPNDEKTKQAFDSHQISIYSDAWNNNYPLNTSESDRIRTGNSYTFDRVETAHFLLMNNNISTAYGQKIPTPTFTVIVTAN